MRILYATDGTEPSVAAGRLIEKLIRRETTSITVLSVAPTMTVSATALPIPLPNVDEEKAYARRRAERSVRELARAGFEVTCRVEAGAPADRIMAVAADDAFDVVVMGAGSTNWLSRAFLGSVSAEVLHRSPVPTLVVHEVDPTTRGHVLIGIDGTAPASEAVAFTAALLDPGRCDIHVVDVVPRAHPVGVPIGAAYIATPPDPAIDAQRVEAARRCCYRTRSSLEEWGFNVISGPAMGSPARVLVEESEFEHADLTIVGHRGLGALQRALGRSVGDVVARRARASLIVKQASAITAIA
ncbi:MAG TPA: universal stress protein [Actinomycetota bacterium]|nr:universal stress protein [Actinomycetota bacterium]